MPIHSGAFAQNILMNPIKHMVDSPGKGVRNLPLPDVLNHQTGRV